MRWLPTTTVRRSFTGESQAMSMLATTPEGKRRLTNATSGISGTTQPRPVT